MFFAPPDAHAQQQDAIVFVLDDVSDADLDLVATPAIDGLAQEGIRFRRAYSMPLCSASRFAMMFGQWRPAGTEAACEATEDFTAIRPNLPTMMRCQGYTSACFGKWHVGTATPWQRVAEQTGFGTWLAGMPGNVKNCGGTSYTDWVRVDQGVAAQSSEYNTEAIRDAFLGWWPTASSPRFAWVALQAPHAPIHRPPAHMLPPNYPPTQSNRERWEAMLVSADKAIGDMLSAVDLSQTVVIVVADNGTPAQVATTAAKGTTLEAGIRIPMVWHIPAMIGGYESEVLVHLSDIMLGLRMALGISPDAKIGHPWVYSARDSSASPFKAINRWGSVEDHAIIEQRWKLREVDGVFYLYDLENDPGETSPLPPVGENFQRLCRILKAVKASGSDRR